MLLDACDAHPTPGQVEVETLTCSGSLEAERKARRTEELQKLFGKGVELKRPVLI